MVKGDKQEEMVKRKQNERKKEREINWNEMEKTWNEKEINRKE